jgi:hypothetical protein
VLRVLYDKKLKYLYSIKMTSSQSDKCESDRATGSNIENLLAMISCTTDSIALQSRINIYLKEILDVPYVFMVPLLRESNETLIQVVNDRRLDKELRFSVSKV